jgi:DNA-binding transcriptional ArsR family regulator
MKERRDVFFAIADESRRTILETLARENRPLSIAMIAHDFKMSRNGVNKHINVLRESGLVSTEFFGRENHVSLESAKLAEVHQWVSIFEDFWKGRLIKLKAMTEAKSKLKKRQEGIKK